LKRCVTYRISRLPCNTRETGLIMDLSSEAMDEALANSSVVLINRQKKYKGREKTPFLPASLQI
jgi:hypothetical protein